MLCLWNSKPLSFINSLGTCWGAFKNANPFDFPVFLSIDISSLQFWRRYSVDLSPNNSSISSSVTFVFKFQIVRCNWGLSCALLCCFANDSAWLICRFAQDLTIADCPSYKLLMILFSVFSTICKNFISSCIVVYFITLIT